MIGLGLSRDTLKLANVSRDDRRPQIGNAPDDRCQFRATLE